VLSITFAGTSSRGEGSVRTTSLARLGIMVRPPKPALLLRILLRIGVTRFVFREAIPWRIGRSWAWWCPRRGSHPARAARQRLPLSATLGVRQHREHPGSASCCSRSGPTSVPGQSIVHGVAPSRAVLPLANPLTILQRFSAVVLPRCPEHEHDPPPERPFHEKFFVQYHHHQ
jgi:hypothetical protein